MGLPCRAATMRELEIAGTTISDESDAYVVAEIGHNHQGDLAKCKALFKAAKDCGADAVKLQKRDNKALFTPEMYRSPYNSENAYAPTYGEHREFLEFGLDEYRELQEYAVDIDITFFATAFDLPSLEFLIDLSMPAVKIASADLTYYPLLEAAAEWGGPVIISTGAAQIKQVRAAHKILKNVPHAILQCTACYPAAFEDLDLNVIGTYRDAFPDTVIGLSDHDKGIAMAPVAYALGARIIEKHFTLDRTWKGTDQAFSLEPVGLRKIVRDLKRTRVALGDGVKKVYDSELGPMAKMRKNEDGRVGRA